MTTNFWQSIATTPWWVFVLFAYLVKSSLSATKPRLTPVQQFYFMPFFLVGLSAMYMCAIVKTVSPVHLSIWSSATLLGTGLGYLQFQFSGIRAVANSRQIYVPGNWLPLIALIACAILKFYFHYSLPFNSNNILNPAYSILIVLLYGLISGVFLGRLSFALRGLKDGPFIAQESMALT